MSYSEYRELHKHSYRMSQHRRDNGSKVQCITCRIIDKQKNVLCLVSDGNIQNSQKSVTYLCIPQL